MNEYYVYIHYRADGVTPFYVGKGKGSRAYDFGKTARSQFWHNVVMKEFGGRNPIVHIIKENLDDDTAKALEKFYIKAFGRKDVSPDGLLVNLTDGGDGSSGYKPPPISEETRKRLSASQIGKNFLPKLELKWLPRN